MSTFTYDNYKIFIDKTNNIYIRVVDTNLYTTYEETIKELTLSDYQIFKTLDNLHTVIIKCIENGALTFEHEKGKLIIALNFKICDVIDHIIKICLYEQQQTSEIVLSKELIKFQKRFESMIGELNKELEQYKSVLDNSVISIGDHGMLGVSGNYPLFVETRVESLYLSRNTSGYNYQIENNNKTFLSLNFSKFKYLYNLKNLMINRLNDINTDDVFDWGVFEHVEILSITGCNITTLENIDKITNLKELKFECCPNLENAHQFLVKSKTIKKLTFNDCPKLKINEGEKLAQYCAKNNIALQI
jgi:hypothetical protein